MEVKLVELEVQRRSPDVEFCGEISLKSRQGVPDNLDISKL